MADTVFYENGGVLVTNSRFVVRGTTYAMNGITSIRTWQDPPKRMAWIVGIVIGFALFGAGTTGFLIGAAIIGVCGYVLYSQKPTLYLMLSTAGGEVQALSDTNAEFITSVTAALNDALVHRG